MKYLNNLGINKDHTAHIWSVSWSPNGKYIATSSGDWSIQIWAIDTKKTVAKLTGHGGPVYDCTWSPDSDISRQRQKTKL